MKKLVYIVPHYSSLDEGSSLRSVAIARFLSENQYKVVVIAPDTLERSLKKRVTLSDRDGEVIIKYASGLQGYRKSFLKRLLHEVVMSINSFKTLWLERPDIVIVSYPPAFSALITLLYKVFSKTKVVLEVRDLMAGALSASKYTKSKIIIKLAHLYEKLIVKSSDAVAIVSPGMRETILKYDENSNIIKSYNGIEDTTIDFSNLESLPRKLDESYNKVLAKISYSENDKLIIYAGALTQSYDVLTIIKSVEMCKDINVKLLILGDGDKKQEYEEYVNNLKIPNIYFNGFVNRLVALNLMRLSSVAIHSFNSNPHWSYVLGNKVFDYMATGTPVLFSGMGTTADVILDCNAGLVSEPGNVMDFNSKLNLLLNDNRYIGYGENAKKCVFRKWKRSDQMNIFIRDLNKLNLV
jgi:glycosyltransferase involved in cell wall biosynthesis